MWDARVVVEAAVGKVDGVQGDAQVEGIGGSGDRGRQLAVVVVEHLVVQVEAHPRGCL